MEDMSSRRGNVALFLILGADIWKYFAFILNAVSDKKVEDLHIFIPNVPGELEEKFRLKDKVKTSNST